jgi:hypothetical protein
MQVDGVETDWNVLRVGEQGHRYSKADALLDEARSLQQERENIERAFLQLVSLSLLYLCMIIQKDYLRRATATLRPTACSTRPDRCSRRGRTSSALSSGS